MKQIKLSLMGDHYWTHADAFGSSKMLCSKGVWELFPKLKDVPEITITISETNPRKTGWTKVEKLRCSRYIRIKRKTVELFYGTYMDIPYEESWVKVEKTA